MLSKMWSMEDFDKSFKEISQIQLESFRDMIPASVISVWEKGLYNDDYYFKLSGAGGGGYYLVYKNTETVDIDLVSLD